MAGGVAARGAAGCSGTTAVVATGALWALDTEDSVDAVAAVVGTMTLKVFAAGVLTTRLAATVLPGPALSVAAEEADEFAVTPADVDDDRPDSDL